MRCLAIARFRLLTIVRTGTSIFLIAAIPPLLALIPLSTPEPLLRVDAPEMLPLNARVALVAWLFHAIFLGVSCLASGKLKTAHADVSTRELPDLIDTAPVGPAARFWGEALGTLGAAAIVHACCLPLLAAVAALSPLPTAAFLSIEVGAIAMIVLGSAGAAWQRRAPRTKYSGSRGPRNAVLFAILLLMVLRHSTTQWEVFRDSLLGFLAQSTSMRAWAEVVGAADRPLLLFTLLALLYFGNIAYYYVSATRKRLREN